MEGELQKIRDGILALTDKSLVSSACTGELQVFYYKMKSDYYRYLAEFATGEAKSKAVEDAQFIDELRSVDSKSLSYQVPMIQTVQKTMDVPQLQFLNKVDHARRFATTDIHGSEDLEVPQMQVVEKTQLQIVEQTVETPETQMIQCTQTSESLSTAHVK